MRAPPSALQRLLLALEAQTVHQFMHPWGTSYKVQVVHKMDDEEWEYRLDCASL